MRKRKAPNPKITRVNLGLSQEAFWKPIGVTQSGGSRYESGRPMPKPVRLLFELAYGSGTHSDLVNGALAKSI